jgi:hypothetical protein
VARTRSQEDLLAKMAGDGCPICAVLRDAERAYWDFLLYEGFQDPGIKERLRDAGGYCRRHRSQLARHVDPYAQAVLALVTLDGVAHRLERRPRLRIGRRRVPRVEDDCPLCDALAGTEAALTDDLVALAEAGGLPADRYAASDGACLDHVGRAVARGARRDSAFLRDAGRRIEAVRGDLRDYLASFDHRATDRAGIEVDPGAWRRALALVGGEVGRVRTRRRPRG